MKIGITTDSGIVQKSEDIIVVPLIIIDDPHEYRDGIDITNEEIFKQRKIKTNSSAMRTWKTSTASPGDYLDAYEDCLKTNDRLIHLSISSGLSGAYNVSSQAASMMDNDNVHVIDSKQGASGGAILLHILQNLIEQGVSYKEIIDAMENYFVTKVKTFVFLPNAIGFAESGRDATGIERKKNIILAKGASMAGIQVSVITDNGRLYQSKKYRFKEENKPLEFVKALKKEFLEECKYIAYGGTFPNEEHMEEIQDYLVNYINEESINQEDLKVIRSDMSGVFAAYGCPGTFAVSGFRKSLKK